MTKNTKKRLGFNPLQGKSGVDALFSAVEEHQPDKNQDDLPKEEKVSTPAQKPSTTAKEKAHKSPNPKLAVKKEAQSIIKDKGTGDEALDTGKQESLQQTEAVQIANKIPDAGEEENEIKYRTYSVIMREEYVEKLGALAYWERKIIKSLMDEILGEYFSKNTVKPIPENAPGLRRKRYRTKKNPQV